MLTKESMEPKELTQDAEFIRNAYRKAALSGMLSILSVNINVVVDGILVGRRLGPDALAAINLSMPVWWALCVVGAFLAAGTEIPAARAMGIGDSRRRDIFFRTGLNVSVLASVFITVLGLIFLRPLVSFLGADGATFEYVRQYVKIMLIGALPKIVIYIPFWYLRLDGQHADVSVMMAGMAGINIVLDVLFVYYMNMGVYGAGLASMIATAAACLYGLIRLFFGEDPNTWRPEIIHSWKEWKTILTAGMPSAFNNLCATVKLLLLNSVLMGYGGAGLMAVFSAINGIAGFGECVTLGIPAAGSAMLAVFSGERDNGSCRLLLREEWKTGCLAGIVFSALCLALSGLIPGLYGLKERIFVPLLWMTLSIFPALFLNILTTYYNIASLSRWANVLIFLRMIVMPYAGLSLNTATGFSVFSFLLFGEAATILVWWAATGLRHRRRPQESRYLMANLENERNRQVLNFSVGAQVDEIVSASERISSFCAENGMSVKETTLLEMSMEEVMTLIVQVNAEQGVRNLRFDLRAFAVSGVQGIRIRYSGKAFNPFSFSEAEGEAGADQYLGVRMIRKMVEDINYQRTFGVNALQILLKEG